MPRSQRLFPFSWNHGYSRNLDVFQKCQSLLRPIVCKICRSIRSKFQLYIPISSARKNNLWLPTAAYECWDRNILLFDWSAGL